MSKTQKRFLVGLVLIACAIWTLFLLCFAPYLIFDVVFPLVGITPAPTKTPSPTNIPAPTATPEPPNLGSRDDLQKEYERRFSPTWDYDPVKGELVGKAQVFEIRLLNDPVTRASLLMEYIESPDNAQRFINWFIGPILSDEERDVFWDWFTDNAPRAPVEGTVGKFRVRIESNREKNEVWVIIFIR